MASRFLKLIFITISLAGVYLGYMKIELIRQGGIFMVPILFCSMLAFAVIFSKMVQFSRMRVDSQGLLKSVFEALERQRLKEAVDICNNSNSPVAKVLKAGIMKYDRPKDELKEAMQDSFLYENPQLEEQLPILSTIIQITPLFGFLGALAGMMNAIYVLQAKNASGLAVNVMDIAPGIWQALICSAFGFLVAIPLVIANNFLNSHIKHIVDEMERAATELLNFLMDRRMNP